MIFPKDFPDKLRSSILVSEVVGKKVKLKSNGKEFGGLCPFHNEKTPSFTVNDQKGFYHCFGCAAHGDIITFVMHNEGLDFKDAVVKLADDFSIAIPQVNFNQEKENQIERDFLILEKICTFFEKNLISQNSQTALSYLRNRRIDNQIIKKFRLGFAPNSYDELVNFLKNEGFSEEEITASGVIGKNEKSNLYAKFRNRIIFPITNKKGKVIAFGGRTIADDLPKYLNSSETNLFKKNQTLYNYFFARKAIFDKGYAVMVEGYMDTISLSANGLQNVVAGLGTALGAEHLKELFVITDKIVICLDGDLAGIKAAKRVSEIALPLITAKKNIAFAFLPNQLDPDDFIKEFGANELEKQFLEAKSLSESLFDFALMELNVDKNKINAETKAKIESSLISKSELIKDITVKKHFILFFKDVLFHLGKGRKLYDHNNINKILYQKTKNEGYGIAIISSLVRHKELLDLKDDIVNFRETNLVDEELNILKDEIIDFVDDNPDASEQNLIEFIGTKSIRTAKLIKNYLEKTSYHTTDFAKKNTTLLILRELLIKINNEKNSDLDKEEQLAKHRYFIEFRIKELIKELT